MKRVCKSLVLFCWAFSGGEISAAVALEPVVVKGLRLEKSWRQLAQPVSVVDEKELRRSEGRALGEILEGRPGAQILVKGNGFAYGKSGISLRSWGMGSEIVVALDGRRLSNDTDGEGFDLSLIDPVVLSQIEVLRGSLSSVYGNGAHAGVLHLSTRQDSENKSGFSVSVGSNGTQRESFYSFKNNRKWFLALAGSNEASGDVRTPDQGIFGNSAYHRGTFYASAKRKLSKGRALKILGLFGRGFKNGLPGDLVVFAPYDRDEMDDRAYGRIEFSGGKKTNYSVLLDINYKARKNIRLGPAGSTSRVNSQQQSRGLGSQATLNGHLGNHQWLLGIENRRENHDGSGEITPVTGPVFQSPKLPPSRVESMGAFFQDEWSILDESWILSTGGRLDWQRRQLYSSNTVIFDADTNIDKSATGHVGLVKSIGLGGIRMGAGTSYVAPNIIQLYTFNARTGFALLGNPSLAPERGYTVDAGVFLEKAGTQLELTAFTSEVRDRLETGLLLRDFAGGGTSFKDLNGAFTRPNLLNDPRLVAAPTNKWFYHYNLGQVRVQGLEMGAKIEFESIPGFWLNTSLTAMTYMRDQHTSKWLLELPPVAGRVEMGRGHAWGLWSLEARGSSGYDSISRTRPGRPRVSVEGYILVSANLRIQMTENLLLFVRGDNLLNQPWQSTLDVPGAGISGRTGMELSL